MSCREEKLEGHWHVYGILQDKNHFLTLDIEKDTTAILGKCSFYNNPKHGSYNKSIDRLYIPMECNIGDFKYTVVNENTILLNNSYFKNVLAEKHTDLDSNHFIQDYLDPIDLNINPPILFKESIKIYPNQFNRLIPFRIYIYEKEMISDFESEISYEIQLDNPYKDLNELTSIKEEGLLELLVFPILADKKTPLRKIKSVIDQLISIGIKDHRILIYCLSSQPTDLENPFRLFHYKNINFENLERTLQESI